MQNSGLEENTEAAARVHSPASLGSARECTNAHLVHACADALRQLSQEGRGPDQKTSLHGSVSYSKKPRVIVGDPTLN